MRSRKGSSLALIGIVAVHLLLSACGGAAATADAPAGQPPANPAPDAIEGVATPSSVAVVTATNAN
jgi:hypothetical protein